MILKWSDGNRINVAEDGNNWRAVVNKVLNIRVP
jgi:hypothetical protein